MDSGPVLFPFTRPKGQFLSFGVTLFANLPHFSTFLEKNITVMGLFSTVTIIGGHDPFLRSSVPERRYNF